MIKTSKPLIITFSFIYDKKTILLQEKVTTEI